jgi:MFS family permease
VLIALPFAMTWIWIAMTADYIQLIIARLLCGVFAGMMSMSVPLYIGETAPTHLRYDITLPY